MFNIYQFEKQATKDPKLQKSKWIATRRGSSAEQHKRKNDKHQSGRERMVTSYKSRVTSFIKQMTVKPVAETDYYGKGFSQMSHTQKMVGPQRMNFGATRGDEDRVGSAIKNQSFIDSVPTDPEWTIWKMRPRQKKKEIGPSMRFNSHFQAERLMEQLKNKTQTFFTKDQVTGGQEANKQNLEKNIKQYNKTGKFGFADMQINGGKSNGNFIANETVMLPAASKLPSMSSSPNNFRESRQSRLQRSNYFLEPRKMMSNIHQKTHFKAAISVSRANPVCLKIETNEFGDQFAEISRNIDAMYRSTKEIQTPSTLQSGEQRGQKVSHWLNKNRNCISQGRQQRNIGQAQTQQHKNLLGSHQREYLFDNNKNNTQSDPNSPKSDQPQQDHHMSIQQDLQNHSMEEKEQDWNSMTEEEKQAVQMMSSQDISAEKVTSQVLKLCNIVRRRLDVHGDTDYIKKGSGLGGTGGRQLSPELRVRYGTYGFKKNQQPERQMQSRDNVLINFDDRASNAAANTIQILSSGLKHESQTDARDEMLMETNGSTHAPPNVTSSVDMGMRSGDTQRTSGSGSVGNYPSARCNNKKQVVLKRPQLNQQIRGHSINAKLIKSLTTQTTYKQSHATVSTQQHYA